MKYNLSKQTEYILGLVCEAKELATDFKEQVINSSNVSYELIKPFFNPFMEHHEEFWIILMNKANKPVAFVKVSQGGIDGTVVDNKLIF